MTLLEGLNCLPEPYRTQAFINTNPRHFDKNYSSITHCLNNAFLWPYSNEGATHWLALHRYLTILQSLEGVFYVASDNMLYQYDHQPDSHCIDGPKLIFKIRIKRDL